MFLASFLLLFVDVVVEEFDDQVHVVQDHPSAAVALAAETVESLGWSDALLVDQVEVLVPLVASHLYRSCSENFACVITLPQVKHRTGMIIFI